MGSLRAWLEVLIAGAAGVSLVAWAVFWLSVAGDGLLGAWRAWGLIAAYVAVYWAIAAAYLRD